MALLPNEGTLCCLTKEIGRGAAGGVSLRVGKSTGGAGECAGRAVESTGTAGDHLDAVSSWTNPVPPQQQVGPWQRKAPSGRAGRQRAEYHSLQYNWALQRNKRRQWSVFQDNLTNTT